MPRARSPSTTIGPDVSDHVPAAARVDAVMTRDALRRIGVPDASDLGRQEVTGHASDARAFRTPSLRNVTLTAPYMHDGSLATLEDVVRHYSELNEERLHADGERILRALRLTPGQIEDLSAFVRSLSTGGR